MEKHKEVIHGYVADMIAVERHLIQTIERQTTDDDIDRYPQARDYLNRVSSVLDRHVAALEGYIGDKDAESTLKKAVGTAAGFISDIVDKLRSDTVSKMLRDDYTVLALAIVSYEMLLTTALSWNDNGLARICETHLHELNELLHEADDVICTIVARELVDEGKAPNAAAAEEALNRIREAQRVVS